MTPDARNPGLDRYSDMAGGVITPAARLRGLNARSLALSRGGLSLGSDAEDPLRDRRQRDESVATRTRITIRAAIAISPAMTRTQPVPVAASRLELRGV